MDGDISIKEHFEEIALDRIDPSPSNPRKRVDAQQLAELAVDMEANGQIQPIRVRPLGDRYQLVVGERRWRAMATTQRSTITAIVRDYTDREVLEVQISENGQREDVHPLEEADAFRQLHIDFGVPVADIAARVGTSEAFIQRRISLAHLCDEGREAYFTGKLSHGVAQLVARMPVVEHQQAAVTEFTTKRDFSAPGYDDPWTVAGARRWIQQHFLLRLATAPFDLTDATLVPAAGACAVCPKNSGAQPALFAEVTGEADSCTDASCWKSKVDADWQRKAADVAKGHEVLSAERSAKVVQHHGAQSGYVRLDERPRDVGNGRKTWGEILKKAAPAVVLGRDPNGKAVELIAPAEVKRAMREAGVERKKSSTSGHTEKLVGGLPEYKFRQAVNDRVEERVTAAAIAAVKKGPTAAMWRAAATSTLEYFSANGVATAMFPPPEKNPTGRLDRYIEKATAEQCSAIVLTLLLAGEENADLLKVDPKAIEKELKSELEAAVKKTDAAKKPKGAKPAPKASAPKPSQSPKPAAKTASAPAKTSKNAKPSQSPKKAPVGDLRDIWLPIAGMKALSDDRRAAYNEVDAVVLGYDSASTNLAVAWEPAGLYCHAKLPYEAYLVLWDMAVVDGLNPAKSEPTEPPPTVPPPAAPPPPKASKKKAAVPAKGAHASKSHALDTQARIISSNTACLVTQADEQGTQVHARPPGVSDAVWRDGAAQIVEGIPSIVVARLYSQKSACLWDSRDGALPGTTVRRYHGVAKGDRLTLDGIGVEVLEVDEGGFVWCTTEADPKEHDEGDVEWGDIERVEGTTWRARKVEGDAPAPEATPEAVSPATAPSTPVAAGPAPRIERLADDVLTVLSTMEVDGTVAKITRGNLPRPLYERVNKALEALGGTWSKKLKGHVFADDPTDALDGVILTGEVAHARDVLGWFPTPLELVHQLLDHAAGERGMTLLEPSAGEGAIVGAAIMRGYHVTAVELDPGRQRTCSSRYLGGEACPAVYCADFLRWDTEQRFDRIVMNPPFARQQDIAHVTTAFRLLAPGGRLVAVMSAGVEFREDRKTAAFRDLVNSVEGRVLQNPPGSFKSSGTSVNTVTVVMDRKAVGA